jgi:multiple sugar transport system substrate-binding protein
VAAVSRHVRRKALTILIEGDLMLSRRGALALGLSSSAVAALAACGPNAPASSGGGGDDAEGGSGGGKIRLAWWGNPTRNEMTDDVKDAFEKANDGVSITKEPGDWDGYWDKLATQVAGGDMPDVVQMDEQYLAEYASRGALLDLEEAGLDVSGFEDSTVDIGRVADAGLAAISAGVGVAAVHVNTQVFDDAGVDLPDDSTWTWEDFQKVAEDVSKKSGDGIYGASQLATNPAAYPIWMRQQGQALWKGDGIGFEEGAAKSFFEFMKTLGESDGTPSADLSVEDGNQGPDQSLFGTGKMGMMIAWSTQSVQYDEMLDDKVKILRLPSQTGKAEDVQLWNKPSMYWAISSKTKDPDTAVKLVDFLVNSEDAGKIMQVERGVPGNTTVRDAVSDDLSDRDTKPVEYHEAIEGELGDAPDPTPAGGTVYEDSLKRAGEDLMFGKIDPAAAAKSMVDELTSGVA